jgi:hypothetical protein
MHRLHVALLVLIVTLLSILGRFTLPGDTPAVQAPQIERAEPVASSALQFVQHSTQADDEAETLLARLAAQSGMYLLDQARKHPNRPALLRQAAAHLRACLSHEETLTESTALFQEVRKKLAEVESLLQASKSAPVVPHPKAGPGPVPAPSKPEKTPVVPPASESQPAEKEAAKEPAPTPDAPKSLEVGPDGIIYKKLDKTNS